MENQQQQQLKPRLSWMDEFPQMNFVGYEKHPYYVEFYEGESESESEDEDDEQTIQYRKEMEEGCPEGYTTIWNSYGFSYEKMEEQEQNYIRYGNAETEPEGLRDFIVPEEEE